MATLVRATNEGNGSPEALFNWYAGRTYTGALGEVRFDEKGDAAYPYMYKKIIDGRFQLAEFQFALLLEKTRQQINNIFDEMYEGVEQTAQKLSSGGITGKEAKTALQALFDKNEYAFDCATVDRQGIIVNVAPEKFSSIIGMDISHQEQIVRLHATHKPTVSHAIDTVEGFVGFDLEHPVFSKDGDFIGSVSILTEPGFLRYHHHPENHEFSRRNMDDAEGWSNDLRRQQGRNRQEPVYRSPLRKLSILAEGGERNGHNAPGQKPV